MRELKFRAWNTTRNCWTSRVELDLLYEKPMLLHGEFENDNGYLTDNTIIEQYTGLKDKNGKEIYEGDILGGIWEGCYIDRCDKCKQHQVFTTFGCMACSGDVHWYEIANDNDLEVVGNIHENPELLEEE